MFQINGADIFCRRRLQVIYSSGFSKPNCNGVYANKRSLEFIANTNRTRPLLGEIAVVTIQVNSNCLTT